MASRRRLLDVTLAEQQCRDNVLSVFILVKRAYMQQDYVIQPLNLPPRYSDYAKGRVLVEFNTSADNTDTPWPTEPFPPPLDYWNSPVEVSHTYCRTPPLLTAAIANHCCTIAITATIAAFTASTDALAKELKDTYAESFDDFQLQQGTPRYQELETLVLPYLPYFSSCRGYDGHIPIYAALESKACHLPGEEDGVSDDWWRYAYPPFPHQDDIHVVGPWHVGQKPTADYCKLEVKCQYEEALAAADVVPRWFEAGTGATLFEMIREPITWHNFTGRANTRASLEDTGGAQFIRDIEATGGSDFFVPVKLPIPLAAAAAARRYIVIVKRCCCCADVDVAGAAHHEQLKAQLEEKESASAALAVAALLAVEICYHCAPALVPNANTPLHCYALCRSLLQQYSRTEKRIINARLIMLTFDKNSTDLSYNLTLDYYALDYWGLIKYFVFRREVFWILFAAIGVFSVVLAAIYWVRTMATLYTSLESCAA
eukprot:9309-Heterococcus_DN1.PRE.2